MKLISDWGFSPNSWQGQRGEYWLLLQAGLMLGFAVLPVYRPAGWELPIAPEIYWLWVAASLLGGFASVLLIKGLIDLGQNLTPLPHPKDDGQLVQTGVYRIVRHPLYGGITLGAIAWAVCQLSLSHLMGAMILLGFFNAKASREESWLCEKFPEYKDYRHQVKKLIPWVY